MTNLHPLLSPAADQVAAKWATLPAETRKRLVDNLPDHAERVFFLEKNALVLP